MELTFEQLPKAVNDIFLKLDSIERLIKRNIDEPPQPEQDELLTVLQVAELLKLSVPTIYGKVHNSEIPHSKQGKRLYFSKLEIMDWIKVSHKQKTWTETEIEAIDRMAEADKKKGLSNGK